ncbi:LysE/ArgO family amino acid transporter [Leptolyngbya iicbica]|uniref:LysE family translocator n=2 Tax=Cyanophyceae TaxID=3028117 RepID=A0A4Q7E1M9_9CYAN|nr:LysE family transporter [Leptolyngbya sp. LK]RZM75304.1 LysE family translocator [Leptolyngbya sp. LK]
MLSTFSTGLILGLSIAAPVGPIGILCIRRTLVMGQWVGLVSGLGAATADGLYGCIAGFGLTAIADFLTHQSMWLRIVGGLFLCYLGITTFLSKPPTEPAALSETELSAGETASLPRSLVSAYGSTLALTLTNPATILSFAAIFAGLGIVDSAQSFTDSGILVLGVFIGSALWWFFLSGLVSLLRNRFTPAGLRWLNRLSGVILLAFGMVALTL